MKIQEQRSLVFVLNIEDGIKHFGQNIECEITYSPWNNLDRSDAISVRIRIEDLLKHASGMLKNEVSDKVDHYGDHVQKESKATVKITQSYFDDNKKEVIEDFLKHSSEWEIIDLKVLEPRVVSIVS